MVKSQNGLFNAQLIRPKTKEPFPEVIGWDKKCYVIGEAHQNFQIRLTTVKKGGVYACTLSIDGQTVCKGKCFKDVGHFFGFKKNYTEYEMFEFMIPEIVQDFALPSVKIKELKEKMGNIVIELYEVKKVRVSHPFFQQQQKNGFLKTEYTPLKRLQDKKLFQAPLTIKRGGIYKNNKVFNNNYKDGMMDRIDYQKHIDTITIRYSDFYTLLISDHINLYNKDHLRFIPIPDIKKNLFLLEKMIITIIKSFKVHEKIGLSERFISDELKRYTKMRFEELGVGSLRDYLLSKKSVFFYNPETDRFLLNVSGKKFKVCCETLQDLKAGNLIDPKYYSVPRDKENFILKKPNGDFDRNSKTGGIEMEFIVID